MSSLKKKIVRDQIINLRKDAKEKKPIKTERPNNFNNGIASPFELHLQRSKSESPTNRLDKMAQE